MAATAAFLPQRRLPYATLSLGRCAEVVRVDRPRVVGMGEGERALAYPVRLHVGAVAAPPLSDSRLPLTPCAAPLHSHRCGGLAPLRGASTRNAHVQADKRGLAAAQCSPAQQTPARRRSGAEEQIAPAQSRRWHSQSEAGHGRGARGAGGEPEDSAARVSRPERDRREHAVDADSRTRGDAYDLAAHAGRRTHGLRRGHRRAGCTAAPS